MIDKKISFPYRDIFKIAYLSCIDRLWQFILISIASIVLFLICFIFIGIISVSFLFIAKLIHPILLFILVVPLLLTSLGALFYISSWSQLALLDVFVNDTINIPVRARFKKLQPMVIGFVWFNILSFLFILGLVPLGVLTVGIVLLYWGILGSFAGFIYLLHKPSGLGSLWRSASMAKKYIFEIALVLGITYGINYSIDMLLLKSDHAIPQLFSYLKNIFVTPFIISLKYEMFKLLPKNYKDYQPMRWILASKIGIVIMVILGAITISFLINNYPLWRNIPIKTPESLPFGNLM